MWPSGCSLPTPATEHWDTVDHCNIHANLNWGVTASTHWFPSMFQWQNIFPFLSSPLPLTPFHSANDPTILYEKIKGYLLGVIITIPFLHLKILLFSFILISSCCIKWSFLPTLLSQIPFHFCPNNYLLWFLWNITVSIISSLHGI